MNTIDTYTKNIERKPKISKKELLERMNLLSDVVQALIDRAAKKEKIQIGVMAESRCVGLKYVLYEQPLIECYECKKALPVQKHGDEVFFSIDKNQLCYDCYGKRSSNNSMSLESHSTVKA